MASAADRALLEVGRFTRVDDDRGGIVREHVTNALELDLTHAAGAAPDRDPQLIAANVLMPALRSSAARRLLFPQ